MAFPTGWTAKWYLAIQHAQVPADQTQFPVLVTEVSFPGGLLTTGGADAAQSDGGDLRFSTDQAGSAQIACEVVRWVQNANPTLAKAEVWIPVNVLTAADVPIYVWTNNSGGLTQPAAGSTYGSQAVWDSHTKARLHLPDGTTLTALDSTSNGNNGTVTGLTVAAGQIDGGAASSGATGNQLALANNLYTLIGGSAVHTVSFWIKPTSRSDGPMLFDGATGGLGAFLELDGSGGVYWGYGGSYRHFNGTPLGTFPLNVWTHIAMVKTAAGNHGDIYFNGILQVNGSGTSATIGDPTNVGATIFLNYSSAGNEMAGSIDEIGIDDTNRSGNWILTEYNNQYVPSTFVVSALVPVSFNPACVGQGRCISGGIYVS